MKYNTDLPLSEKRHFMKCNCGEYFDMRDLKDVIAHFHEYKAVADMNVQFFYSIKVGEPIIYTNKGKQLNGN